jgi:hypothetical protein
MLGTARFSLSRTCAPTRARNWALASLPRSFSPHGLNPRYSYPCLATTDSVPGNSTVGCAVTSIGNTASTGVGALASVGVEVSTAVGNAEGSVVGSKVGSGLEISVVGAGDGISDGNSEGAGDGISVGALVCLCRNDPILGI